MTLPLVFLALLSIVAGWYSKVPDFLGPPHEAETSFAIADSGLIAVPLLGFLVAAKIYWKAEPSDAPVKAALGKLWTLVENNTISTSCTSGS